VVLKRDYDEFGLLLAETGSEPGSEFLPFGFAGGLYDEDSGLVQFGARAYDPEIGRWISKEPLRFRGGSNFFAYAFNDPVNLVDPTGRSPTGAGGASGEGGSEGAGNLPIQSEDPWVPPQDWCGSVGSEWVPEGAFGVDWSDACKTHDECYAECGSSKYLCDWNLSEDMSLSCAAQDGGLMCHSVSGVYFTGVDWFGGKAYFDAQADCVCQ
jgi:RHS repeat-associated protein